MVINYVAVLVATIAAFAVGMLWYTVLFGKAWRRLMGVAEGQKGPEGTSMVQSLGGGFIATLVLAFVLATLMQRFGITTPLSAVKLAFALWLGFVATIMTNSVWYERRPWALYFINVSHYLVAIAVAALVLVRWPW